MVNLVMNPKRARAGALSLLATASVIVLSTVGALPASAATTTYAVVDTFVTPGSVTGLAIKDGTTMYVADRGGARVLVVDLASGATTSTITVPSQPNTVAFNPVTHRLYVASWAGVTSVIDTDTDAIVASINTGVYTSGIAVNTATNTVYVTGGSTSQTVYEIDGSTNLITGSVDTIGSGNYQPIVDQVTNRIFVPSQNGSTLTVIDGAAFAITAAIPVGANPQAVAVDEGTATVYVTNGGANSISVISEASNTVTATIAVGATPGFLVVDPATHVVYSANYSDSTVSIIDGTTNTVIQTLPVGDGPYDMLWDATTDAAYSSNYAGGTVSKIQLVTSPTITTATLPTATIGQAYSATVAATGTGPILFALESGTLPPGLTLDPETGIISGTPTTVGSYTFEISATNAYGTTSQLYTLGAAVAVVAVVPTALAATGFDAGFTVGAAGIVLIAGLTLLAVAARRRRTV